MELKQQPSESRPTKNCLDGVNCLRAACGSLLIARVLLVSRYFSHTRGGRSIHRRCQLGRRWIWNRFWGMTQSAIMPRSLLLLCPLLALAACAGKGEETPPPLPEPPEVV